MMLSASATRPPGMVIKHAPAGPPNEADNASLRAGSSDECEVSMAGGGACGVCGSRWGAAESVTGDGEEVRRASSRGWGVGESGTPRFTVSSHSGRRVLSQTSLRAFRGKAQFAVHAQVRCDYKEGADGTTAWTSNRTLTAHSNDPTNQQAIATPTHGHHG